MNIDLENPNEAPINDELEADQTQNYAIFETQQEDD